MSWSGERKSRNRDLLGLIETALTVGLVSKHSLRIIISASRLVVMYLAGTTGRKTSSADMYTNVRFGEVSEPLEEDVEVALRNVSQTMTANWYRQYRPVRVCRREAILLT
jgi:hypothetical protein